MNQLCRSLTAIRHSTVLAGGRGGDISEAIIHTANWYEQWMKGSPMRDISAAQIDGYEALDTQFQRRLS